MILSMTGYGRASGNFENKKIDIEIRSVNSKFGDVRIKIPNAYKHKEIELKKITLQEAHRGKIELVIDVNSPDKQNSSINHKLVKSYFNTIKLTADELGVEIGERVISRILTIPEVIENNIEELDQEEYNKVLLILEEALQNFSNFRKTEGQTIYTDLKKNIDSISADIEEISKFEVDRIEIVKNRISKSLGEFMKSESVDKNRFEQELIYYIEKIDINEEKVRLNQHCSYFNQTLDSNEHSIGKKLNFISQEIGREINTLGAKAYHASIQHIIVKMKDSLEKIKEQIANSV